MAIHQGVRALLLAGVVLLPLIVWPDLERPFSTPKLVLLGGMDALIAALVLWSRPCFAPGWPWLIWFGSLALSAAIAPYVSLQAILLVLLPVPLRFASLPALRLKQAALLGSTIASVVLLLQYLGADPMRWFGWQPESFASPRMRVYGTFGNPDFAAAWLCGCLPLWFGLLEGGGLRRRSWPVFAGMAVHLAAILATGSRAFLVAVPAIAGALAIARFQRWKWALAGLPVAAALVWTSPARPLEVAAAGRLYLNRVALSRWQEIPPAGFGPGSFPLKFAGWQVEWLRSRSGDKDAARFAGPLDHAHNDYVEMLVEYGPLGLAAFLGLAGWLIREARRSAADLDGPALAGVAALSAVALVDFPFHRPAEWALFWLLLGMLARKSSVANDLLTRRTAECSSYRSGWF